ncbi:putative RNA-binding protein Luc7-like 1 isoform X1 [Strigops habroptila]|uniref:putative RNA-binding protein Luc7-like 1 isoform X1 n=2 Tax=Strigops habroptila TaxID=2489341 RepID=UPI0011D02AA0|nr:putative RNA-binding protein Luc7-like 1 isoform X1 [Strigops habroptila]
MSAQAQMRALLDQLMGTARDGDETRQRVKFTDDRVCKSHLLDCCPHDILAGTRMDLGECTKIHDLALRADYEIASKERDLFFELDAMDHLESFIAECDRRTELAKKRLAETQEEISAEVSAKAEKVHELNEDIGKLLAKAEQLGAEGNVDESQKILMEVEKVRAKKKEAEEEYRNSMPASSFQQQKLRVCEVCSAYLGLHDNDRRLADHFGGKLHLGFIQIREKLDQLRKTVAEKQEKRNQDRLRRREEREREERMGRRAPTALWLCKWNTSVSLYALGRQEQLQQSGSRNRDRRRSRSRDRRRRRSRSASRERRKSRSRSRDRHRRHRSRSRSHSRGHRRGSRDRSSKHKSSRDRSSREKSRDRERKEKSSSERRHESTNGKSRSKRSEEREAGEI